MLHVGCCTFVLLLKNLGLTSLEAAKGFTSRVMNALLNSFPHCGVWPKWEVLNRSPFPLRQGGGSPALFMAETSSQPFFFTLERKGINGQGVYGKSAGGVCTLGDGGA